jgi:hypothetical protein
MQWINSATSGTRRSPIRSETTDPELLREQISVETVRGIEAALTEPLTDEEKGIKERNLLS